jgi:hypothetical protein
MDGCDLRGQTPRERNAVVCTDRLTPLPNGPVSFGPDGPIHRFRALLPTNPELSVGEVFSLYLSISGYSINWPLQEHLFQSILESLKPY